MENTIAASVYVLDPADIEGLDASSLAMLQALYSRSASSVTEHVKRVGAEKSTKFMEQYYIGYGHDSIADTGNFALCFERVSLLAAKAIQTNPLYNGQECSTRYIDFSNQSVVDPMDSAVSKCLQKSWVSFYTESEYLVEKALRIAFPRNSSVSESVYSKTVKALSFDIRRGWLPAGVTTNMSWYTSLRQARVHLARMQNHVLGEVSALGDYAHHLLLKKYPACFSSSRSDKYKEYDTLLSHRLSFTDTRDFYGDTCEFISNVDVDGLLRQKEILDLRPAGRDVPRVFSRYGTMTYNFSLDYGSYRDLQRHRDSFINTPRLQGEFNMHPWYMDMLREVDSILGRESQLYRRAVMLLDQHNVWLGQLEQELIQLQDTCSVRKEELGYYYPLGQQCAISLCASVPELVYILELRSSKTVHPTLRMTMNALLDKVKEVLPWLTIYATPCDVQALSRLDNESLFYVQRGYQDIVPR